MTSAGAPPLPPPQESPLVPLDQPAGIGIREDAHRITQDTSRYVPHAIVGD